MAKAKHKPTAKAKAKYISNMKKSYNALQKTLGAHGHLNAQNKLKK